MERVPDVAIRATLAKFESPVFAEGFDVLRENGVSPRCAAEQLAHMDTADKNELLFRYGVSFNDLPAWQKRGMAFYRVKEEKLRSFIP